MTDEQKAIQGAYIDTISKLYSILWDRYITGEKANADAAFSTGLDYARQARDRALSLVIDK